MNAQELFETARKELQFLRMYEQHKRELIIFLSEVCGEDRERQQELQEIQKAEKAVLQQALARIKQTEQILGSMADGISRTLLYDYYLLGMTWEQVSAELGYSHEAVRGRMRSRALRDAQSIVDEELQSILKVV